MATDEDLVRVAGLDAAIYINFFSTGVILIKPSVCVCAIHFSGVFDQS